MSIHAVYSAVKSFLEANWTATPIVFGNQNFQQEDGAFVFVEVRGGLLEQTSIGSGSPAAERWVSQGSVMLHVAVPAGTGVEEAYQHADALTDLMRGLELPGDLRFRDMTVDPGAPDDDGTMFVVSIRADWIRG